MVFRGRDLPKPRFLSGRTNGVACATLRRHLALSLGVLVPAACAPTVNLTRLDGPRFDGHYASAPDTVSPGTGPIRVVTFNIKLSRQIDRAIEVLKREPLRSADIFALEEMDDAGVERIARSLGLDYVYFPSAVHPSNHRYFGPAVLSRWPIERGWKLVLPHAGAQRHQRRTATGAVVLVRGTPVRVYAVHLELQTRVSREERRDQAEAILSDAAGSPDPVVIAGDFNSHDIGWYLEKQGYRWPTERVGRTTALFSFDHIFARGLAPPAEAAAAGVVRDKLGASDHHPVWADLVLEPAPGRPAAPAGLPPIR
jgi:endonuclease/exonuclease/phosphatase family metal-dependent hydrolase